MVFTANAAVVLDRKVLLARFLCAERQGEETHNRRFFEALRARGVVDQIVEPPAGLFFEGAGDAIWDANRRLIWTGYGQRSSRDVFRTIEDLYGVPAIALELIDPRFYHLDTCFCVLSGGDVLWYPAAFSASAASAVREIVGEHKLIEATDEDAFQSGCQLGVHRARSRDVPRVSAHALRSDRARLSRQRRPAGIIQSLGRRGLLSDIATGQFDTSGRTGHSGLATGCVTAAR